MREVTLLCDMQALGRVAIALLLLASCDVIPPAGLAAREVLEAVRVDPPVVLLEDTFASGHTGLSFQRWFLGPRESASHTAFHPPRGLKLTDEGLQFQGLGRGHHPIAQWSGPSVEADGRVCRVVLDRVERRYAWPPYPRLRYEARLDSGAWVFLWLWSDCDGPPAGET